MSVTNRKMFRRDARNKVRQMGGIMASSEPLVQEVAKFKDGNSVYNPNPSFFYETLKRLGYVPDILKSKNIRVQDPSQLNPSSISQALKDLERPDVETKFGQFKRNIRKPFALAPAAVADAVEAGLGFNPLNPNQLTDESILAIEEGFVNKDGKKVFAPRPSGVDMIQQIKNSGLEPTKISELLGGMDPNLLEVSRVKDTSVDTRMMPGGPPGASGTGTGLEPVTIKPDKYGSGGEQVLSTEDLPEGVKVTFGEGTRFRKDAEEEKLRKDTAAAKLTMQEAEREAEQLAMREAEKPKAIAGGMPMPGQEVTDTFALQQQISGGQLHSGRGQTLGVTKQQEETYKALQTGDASGAKKNIEDIMKGGAGAQQAGLKQLMKEFTDNAPEYEGMDRGLAIAKIGFAMAAGESPNAVTNIAKAMSDGADMFIADDAKRKDFKRNVQLSALQYGLGEVSKMRGEARTQAREMLKQKFDGEYFVVQDEEGNYQQVFVSNYDRATKGLPKGALTSDFVQAMMKKKGSASDFQKELIKSSVVNYEGKEKFYDGYTSNVDNVISSTNASELLEQVIIQNEQGKLSGLEPAWKTAVLRAATLVEKDIQLDKKYTDRDLAISHLKTVFQQLIPLTLGEAQSANSISDKDVARLADAFMTEGILDGGMLGLIATPTAVLRSKLQKTLKTFHQQQEKALARINDYENNEAVNLFFGMDTRTATPKLLGSYVGEQRKRLQPFLETEGFRGLSLQLDNGVYKMVRPT